MSAIPPNWLGGVIQTQGAQARAAEQRDREAVGEAERSSDAFADKLQTAIENAGRDSQVYSDAEGSGSQGRPFEAPDGNAQPPTDEDAATEQGGLDVEA